MTKSIHFLRKRGLLAAAAPFAIVFGAMPALAQDATSAAPADQQVDQAAAADAPGEDIVVTGSLFRRTNTETPSPVTVLTAENLQRAGITTASDAIRSVSADGAGSIGTGFQGGFSAGGSAVSLRGLGVSSTLVLIDGLRSANFPISDDGHNAYVDLNSIPFSLIERVEVLKDGASSTYGADAIGGVVNLIMKKRFVGVAGTVEGGVAEKGDAGHQRANLTLGLGDYDASGWNFYVNGEYQHDGRVTNHSRGFPYNSRDLLSIGGLDQNTADSSLTVATPNAVVTRVTQADLNNPLSGGAGAPITNRYQLLNAASCANGTFSQNTASAVGTGCRHNLEDEYNQIAPLQRRYSVNGRLSFRVSDNIEGYLTGSYSNSFVSIKGAPRGIRATQPFGGAATTASNNPGIVLPVYICSSGVNCATPGAPGRALNPNNPYATQFRDDPSNGAARIYYLFGDIPFGSDRTNEVIRGTAGLNGSFGDDWNWRAELAGAKDNLELVQHGYLNIAGLLNSINTGAYNFVNPAQNTAAVRNAISPDVTTPSSSSLVSFDASITKALFELPGGPLQLALGGQVRRETLTNNNQNAALDTYALTTSSAFGAHTVTAGYFELSAPVVDPLEITASGRYDHYSEGYGHFSPKVGFKFTPIREFALRGTYSRGFRAPTFAEAGSSSQYSGFQGYTPPANFQAVHGGSTAAPTNNSNPYAQAYNIGSGYNGNPNLKPELSRSFTAGAIFEPTRWLSLTVDYFNVKKSRLIVAGPLFGQAANAYYTQNTSAAGCAAVAAIGAGYSCNLIDAVDPLFPNAIPRVLIINAPFVNANSLKTSGVDVSASVSVPLGSGVKFTSRLEATYLIDSTLYSTNADGSIDVQKYAGTLGPSGLSSGNGTPRIRGNWQNTIETKDFSLSATAYYVGRIKSTARDSYATNDCVTDNVYAHGNQAVGGKFCYINSFINVDMNASFNVNEDFSFFVNAGNVLDARAPIAPGAYSSNPNYLTTWHYAGLIGRTFKAGANFKF